MLLQVSGSPAVLACLSSWIQRRQGPFVLAVGRVGLTEVRWQQQQQEEAAHGWRLACLLLLLGKPGG